MDSSGDITSEKSCRSCGLRWGQRFARAVSGARQGARQGAPLLRELPLAALCRADVVGLGPQAGLEPATSGLGNRCSVH